MRDTLSPDGAVIDFEGFPRFDDRDAFVAVYREMGCAPGVFDIHHGANGFLYPPGRLDVMESAVRHLVEDRDLRLMQGAHARVSVERRTWPRVCEALMEHYAAAAARRTVAP